MHSELLQALPLACCHNCTLLQCAHFQEAVRVFIEMSVMSMVASPPLPSGTLMVTVVDMGTGLPLRWACDWW